MMQRRPVLLVTLMLVALLLARCASPQATPPPTERELLPTTPVAADTPTAVVEDDVGAHDEPVAFRVGLVTDGGKVDDGSLNQGAYQGMQRAAEDLGLALNIIETVRPSDFETNVETFARAGYDMIVTVGALLEETTLVMAEKYPDVAFVAVDVSYETPPDNLMGLAFREDQMGFLAGVLAGLVSERKTVGIVAGMDTPATRRLRSGYENGVRYVCAECIVLTVAIDSSTDLARGRTAALSQIGEGADVVFGVGGPTGSGALLGATQQGIWAIGVDNDEYVTAFAGGSVEGADKIISSAIKRADNAVYSAVKGAAEGRFLSATTIFDVANEGVGLADFHDAESSISDEVRAKLDEVFQMLASGEIDTGVDPRRRP